MLINGLFLLVVVPAAGIALEDRGGFCLRNSSLGNVVTARNGTLRVIISQI